MANVKIFLAILPLFFASFHGSTIEDSHEFDWNKHHDNKELKDIMVAVNKRCPEITRLYSLPEKEHENVPKTTVNNNKLWVIEFAKQPGTHVKGNSVYYY
jgi:hypothetical protein